MKNVFWIFTRGTSSFNLLQNMGVKSTESLDLGLLNLMNESSTSDKKQAIGIVQASL